MVLFAIYFKYVDVRSKKIEINIMALVDKIFVFRIFLLQIKLCAM